MIVRIEGVEALMQTSFAKFFFEPGCDSLADDLSRETVCRCNVGYESKSVNAPICFLLCVLYERVLIIECKQKSAYPKDICMRK